MSDSYLFVTCSGSGDTMKSLFGVDLVSRYMLLLAIVSVFISVEFKPSKMNISRCNHCWQLENMFACLLTSWEMKCDDFLCNWNWELNIKFEALVLHSQIL